MREAHYELSDVYKPSIGGWYALLNEGRFLEDPPTEADVLLSKRFQLLLHIDSPRRLRFYLDQLAGRHVGLKTIPPLEQRMIQMLTFRLLQSEARQADTDWDAGLVRLQQNNQLVEFTGTLRSTVGSREAAYRRKSADG